MKNRLIQLTAVVLLVILPAAGLLHGKMGEEEDAGITVSATYEEEDSVNIHIRSANAAHQADGRYLVEVVFTTDTAQSLEDMRMVTVYGAEQKFSFALTADNLDELHTVCFTETAQPEEVRVEVRAHQTEAGLLLMSDGEGQLCGEAAAPVNGDRILQLSGAQPGASYEIYWVADLSEFLSGMVVLELIPTAQEQETYAVGDRYTTTLTADEEGTAFCNFTLDGFADGVYLMVGEEEAYYVCLPLVEASGEFRSSKVNLSLNEEL